VYLPQLGRRSSGMRLCRDCPEVFAVLRRLRQLHEPLLAHRYSTSTRRSACVTDRLLSSSATCCHQQNEQRFRHHTPPTAFGFRLRVVRCLLAAHPGRSGSAGVLPRGATTTYSALAGHPYDVLQAVCTAGSIAEFGRVPAVRDDGCQRVRPPLLHSAEAPDGGLEVSA
jgi:hypothetical protein